MTHTVLDSPVGESKVTEITPGVWRAFDRAIDLRIMRIRRKIEPDPSRPTVIRTIRGGGYVFSPTGDKS